MAEQDGPEFVAHAPADHEAGSRERARAERAEAALLEILGVAAWEARLTEWRKHGVTAVGTQPTPQEACREIRAIARAVLAAASKGAVRDGE